MSLVIRLSRMGKKGERKFRIVVMEKRSRLGGAPVDTLGWHEKGKDGGKKNINMERFNYWVAKGAIPSQTVAKIAAA